MLFAAARRSRLAFRCNLHHDDQLAQIGHVRRFRSPDRSCGARADFLTKATLDPMIGSSPSIPKFADEGAAQ
jgi:hypothetical protein